MSWRETLEEQARLLGPFSSFGDHFFKNSTRLFDLPRSEMCIRQGPGDPGAFARRGVAERVAK
jgi:hypothetical protein